MSAPEFKSINDQVNWTSRLESIDLASLRVPENFLIQEFVQMCAADLNQLGASFTRFVLDKTTGQVLGFVTLSTDRMKFSKQTGPRSELNVTQENSDKPDYFSAVKIDQIFIFQNLGQFSMYFYILSKVLGELRKYVLPHLGVKYVWGWVDEDSEFFEVVDQVGFEQISKAYSKKQNLREYGDKTQLKMFFRFE